MTCTHVRKDAERPRTEFSYPGFVVGIELSTNGASTSNANFKETALFQAHGEKID